jgi:branched-chain amino acid transport system substrate-binding protein
MNHRNSTPSDEPRSRPKSRVMTISVALAAVALVASACGSSSKSASKPPGSSSSGSSPSGGGTVVVGDATTLSGAIAQLGQTGLQGVQLAISDLNAKGGLMGKTIKLVSADDGVTPATGASEVRNMITADHAAAIFGPVASSVAAAEEQVTNQFGVPMFFYTSNDISLMRGGANQYAFQFVPNTLMEPNAVADFFAKQEAGKQLTIATIAPDYSFGHDTVDGFVSALNRLHVNYKLVAQEYPPLTATNISSYLSAIVNANPDYVFNAQFGGDLVNFTQQAQSFGLFQKTKVIAMYDYDVLKTLGSAAPAGSIGFDRAPFWAIPQVASFAAEYKAKYGDYPSEWAIMGYTAVQGWAYAVQKAGSFDASAVSRALAGATVPTIRGDITIRACDHQAEIPEYVGIIASQPDPTYGVRLYSSTFTAPFSDIAPACPGA